MINKLKGNSKSSLPEAFYSHACICDPVVALWCRFFTLHLLLRRDLICDNSEANEVKLPMTFY